MRKPIDVHFRASGDFGGTVDGPDVMGLGEVVPSNDSVLLAGELRRWEKGNLLNKHRLHF